MKISFIIALLVFIAPLHSWAQSTEGSSGSRVYNQSQTGINARNIYNSPSSSHSSSGPIPLRQILEGRDSGSKYTSSSSYYGGKNYRPYGIDHNSYSIALSPSEIAASRSKRDAKARQLERENTASMKQQSEALQTSQEETAAYLDRFRPDAPVTRGVGVQAPQGGRPIYKKREDDFGVPERVFNSVR